MSLDDIEVADRFELLDVDAVADGSFAHTHVLRSLSRSVNHLMRETESILSLSYRSDVPVGETSYNAIRGVGFSDYVKLIPGSFVRPKKPGVDRADVLMRAAVTFNGRLELQVATTRRGFNPAARSGADNVVELNGGGALVDYELRDLVVDPGPRERFEFWIRGEPDRSAPAPVGSYTVGGTGQSTGQVDAVVNEGRNARFFAVDDGMTFTPNWNTPPAATWARSHVFVVHDGPNAGNPGSDIYTGIILEVRGTNELVTWPSVSVADIPKLYDAFWIIYALPRIRLTHLSIWGNRRF